MIKVYLPVQLTSPSSRDRSLINLQLHYGQPLCTHVTSEMVGIFIKECLCVQALVSSETNLCTFSSLISSLARYQNLHKRSKQCFRLTHMHGNRHLVVSVGTLMFLGVFHSRTSPVLLATVHSIPNGTFPKSYQNRVYLFLKLHWREQLPINSASRFVPSSCDTKIISRRPSWFDLFMLLNAIKLCGYWAHNYLVHRQNQAGDLHSRFVKPYTGTRRGNSSSVAHHYEQNCFNKSAKFTSIPGVSYLFNSVLTYCKTSVVTYCHFL